GQLERLRTELPESAEPLVPKRWAELNTVTIAFGHGLSVAPLQAVAAIGALMNGGRLIPPTFLKRSEADALALATQVVKRETSDKMRYLMRLNVEKGTATKADVKGYYVGGKTGTADKVVGGRYSKTKVLTSFTAVLPADQPRYLLLIMLDEPEATPEKHGFTTSGWNALPVGGAVKPGDLFVAVAGAKAGGLELLPQALAAGAAAVMAERPPPIALPASVPFIKVDDARRMLARAAAILFPRQPQVIAAVTGTSGKTSVAAFTRQIWTALGHASASIGTVGLVSPQREIYGSLTTPDPVELHRSLDQLAREGVTHLAIEASSHGLDQRRLDGVHVAAR